MPLSKSQAPKDIAASGWKCLLRRTLRAAGSQHSSLIGAGIAFFGVWSFFPALAALAAVGGNMIGPDEILKVLSLARLELPESLNVIVVGQLAGIAQHSRTLSSATLIAFLAVALWSGMRAMRGLVAALNIIYSEEEKRSFWHRDALIFAFTCYGGAFLLIVLIVIVTVPMRIRSSVEYDLFAVGRWVMLLALLMFSLAVLYRYGPSRRTAQWRWVSWGATASTVIWAMGSLLFSYYVSRWAPVNAIFGSLGAVIMFFLWAYLTVLTILLGAQVNAEIERQAMIDSPGD
jgi:membrane protein